MKFRIPAWYDKVMDGIAYAIFPPPVKIVGDITAVELTLAIYFVLAAALAVWWSGTWLWGLGVLACAVLAWMVDRWFFK